MASQSVKDLESNVNAAHGNLSGQLKRRTVLEYLGGLPEMQLARKARIPLFKQFMGTDEITIAMFVGAIFGYHWSDHAGQLAKIRKAVGLPDAGGAVKPTGVPI